MIEGTKIPVTTEERLKVMNLENNSLAEVIVSAAKVQRLLKIKLEIMANSEAIALQRLLRILKLESGVIKRDLKILAPTTLTTKPQPPIIPNLRNF